MRNTNTQQRSRSFARPGKPVRSTGRRFGRSPAPTKRGGGATKGMLMAAAPMLGGLVMKKMRSRRQTRRSTSEAVSG